MRYVIVTGADISLLFTLARQSASSALIRRQLRLRYATRCYDARRDMRQRCLRYYALIVAAYAAIAPCHIYALRAFCCLRLCARADE